MNKSNLYKGCLEPIIMQLLKHNGRMYGYEITQQVKVITKGELQITEVLYTRCSTDWKQKAYSRRR